MHSFANLVEQLLLCSTKLSRYSGALLVEITTTLPPYPFYAHLAAANALQYRLLQSNADGGDASFHANFSLDPEQMATTIARLANQL